MCRSLQLFVRSKSHFDTVLSTLCQSVDASEASSKERSRGTAEPALEDGGVHRPEVRRELEVAHVRVAQVGQGAVEATLHTPTDEKQRRGFTVIGAAASVFRKSPSELAECHCQYPAVITMSGKIGVKRR